MILSNQYSKIILWLTTYLVGTTAPNTTSSSQNPTLSPCSGICPQIPMNASVPVVDLPPPTGSGCPHALAFDCGHGYLLQIYCSNPNNFTINDIYCIEDPYYVTDQPPPQPLPCPTASSTTGTTDTVLIVVIVLLAVLLLFSWVGLLVLWLRKRKPSATPTKEAENHYTPTPKKATKEKKKKEKMSMSGRPPLPNPRPTSGEAAQMQAEYDYIDPTTARDDDPNAYLEMVE